ncbi:MAG: hypothetical protein ACXACI_08230 [Candidatus Hodarchaeales archaeon]|jgi:hypothetical protein
MSSYEICRLCGYVRKKGENGGVCAACGAPAKSFAPYEHKASELRRRFLELDFHPVTIHFTVSYAMSLAILFILSLMTDELLGIPLRDDGILDFFVILFPIFVLAGGMSGIIDGKVRYRKIDTPFLKWKIFMSIGLLIISVLVVFAHVASDGGEDAVLTGIEAILILLAVILVSILGLIGVKLIHFIVPRGAEPKKKSEKQIAAEKT